MPVDDSLQRGLESFPVPIFHIDFGVAVTGNVAHFNPLGTADQVGLLKIGQREWLKAILQIRLNRGQTCVLLRGGLPLRRSQTQRELGSLPGSGVSLSSLLFSQTHASCFLNGPRITGNICFHSTIKPVPCS